MDVKRIAEEWEIWNEKVKVAKLEEEAKKIVPEYFHKQIYVFSKKASKRMSTRKLWNYAINIKEEFVLRKKKIYPLLREEREEVCKFIVEQLRKGYIRLSKSPQIVLVFFVEKKNNKKKMVQNYRYLNE